MASTRSSFSDLSGSPLPDTPSPPQTRPPLSERDGAPTLRRDAWPEDQAPKAPETMTAEVAAAELAARKVHGGSEEAAPAGTGVGSTSRAWKEKAEKEVEMTILAEEE
eukprot:scaffold124515_cov30-Phaeocystis_antarctica.AAC.1